MTLLRCVLCVAFAWGVLLFAGPATTSAQDGTCGEPDAIVNRLIDASPELVGIWEIQSCSALRHVQSALICSTSHNLGLGEDSEATLESIHEFKSGQGKGQDVGCNYAIGADGRLSIFATKYADGTDFDGKAKGIVSAILSSFPNATPSSQVVKLGFGDSDTGEELKPFAAAFDVMLGAQAFQTAVWFQIVDGWGVKVRSTYAVKAEEDAITAQLSSSLVWFQAVQAVQSVQ